MTAKIALTSIILFATAVACAARLENQMKEHMKFSVIGIEYVGESDKPITPIVISDSKAGAEWFRSAVLKRSDLEFTDVHVVSATLMAKLIGDAETYSSLGLQGKKSGPGGTVSITIIKPQARSTFLLTTEKGVSLLKTFKNRCKNDESLYSDLAHFEGRISP